MSEILSRRSLNNSERNFIIALARDKIEEIYSCDPVVRANFVPNLTTYVQSLPHLIQIILFDRQGETVATVGEAVAVLLVKQKYGEPGEPIEGELHFESELLYPSLPLAA